MADENKQKALANALMQIQKQFGSGSIMRMGDKQIEPIPAISTGSLGLDVALGIGGLPRGRIVEIYGPESSGKTTLTLSIIAQAQKMGATCAFVDAEHALDPEYAGKLGVCVDDLLVSQPDTGEQALEITDMLVRSNAVDVLIVDSVAALVPKAEIEGEMGDVHVGLQARLMSQALRKITGNIKNANCLVIFINQIRMKIGVMFGSPETTTGGNALKFYASVRLDIRRTGSVKDGDNVVGSETRVKIVKNKVSPPFRQAEFNIIYGQGISLAAELIDLGVTHGFIEKSGAWYSYKGDKIGQGKQNSMKFLEENPAIHDELNKLLREKLLKGQAVEKKFVPREFESELKARVIEPRVADLPRPTQAPHQSAINDQAPEVSLDFESSNSSDLVERRQSDNEELSDFEREALSDSQNDECKAPEQVHEAPVRQGSVQTLGTIGSLSSLTPSMHNGGDYQRTPVALSAEPATPPAPKVKGPKPGADQWFEMAFWHDILEQKRAFTMFKGKSLPTKGIENARNHIESSPALKAEILELIQEKELQTA